MRILAGMTALMLATGSVLAQTAPPARIDADTFKVPTVGNLLRLCSASADDPMAKEATQFCLGVVVGAYSVYDELVRGGKTRSIVCPPEGVTRVDGAAAFVAWAKANPQAGNEHAVDGLFRAWAAKYPCPGAPQR